MNSLNYLSFNIFFMFRKNPAHFKEFDHSTDQALHENKEIDTKKIDKPECEYGTSCYRFE